MACPVSPTHSKVPSIAAFTKPFAPCFPLRSLFESIFPVTLPPRPEFPVAYSLPMLGKTFSPALSDTNMAKGTSQTQRPKNEAISLEGASNPLDPPQDDKKTGSVNLTIGKWRRFPA
ncbi:MAG: hypothetical protein L6R40_002978 [Gallowayella cf. fulva]|nr:MAG: hypothetical protein L6R40_002978 [Xanthomendoza cf. fulva]